MPIRVVLVGLGPIGAAVLASSNGARRFRSSEQSTSTLRRRAETPARCSSSAAGCASRSPTASAGRFAPPSPTLRCSAPALRSNSISAVRRSAEAAGADRHDDGAGCIRGSTKRASGQALDQAARRAKVTVLGTGVNPGFVMDALPIALTAVCERVDRIEVQRIQDARVRRLPFQRKIGAGLTPDSSSEASRTERCGMSASPSRFR